MDIIFLLLPLSLILVGIIVWIFMWSIRSGQYDDLEGPAHRVLIDDDAIQPSTKPENNHFRKE
ncbi:MAG TPA: cbb3-type cytochrome oxidase assembly protein CcoS [Chromatiaceae bacterium]|jgi:cbb3-type cytochrome oxidase maturation protein|nr:cbb3-type cytochrome oxidase assembly protein CcoS [Chromatiaceae bacterium]HIN81416.1 cbb3-type cytochrome oxidase assembly protein CcoS [Chromatiales bacterium]HIA07941.1 cbb3-type cytochrome oxidase assembly protein CcoS [Chromatiaceae bacterium]HIB84981.1 cbb3-type cytochrome oxidase assembly protein CcoS [Chromatiaceae bacterium]HIO14698.1 cbb3-type cytochrome oxidase assembly protein CcoS [Chromatiales bacterium]